MTKLILIAMVVLMTSVVKADDIRHNLKLVSEYRLGLSKDSTTSEDDIYIGFAYENSEEYVTVGSQWMMSLDGDAEMSLYAGPKYLFDLGNVGLGIQSNAIVGIGTQDYQKNLENIDNGDVVVYQGKDCFAQVGANVGLYLEGEHWEVSIHAGYKRNIMIDNVTSEVEPQWITTSEKTAPLDNLYFGISGAYSFSSTANRTGDYLRSVTAGYLWDQSFGSAAEIATGWTFRIYSLCCWTTEAGLDYYWQSNSLAGYIKTGVEVWPWGNDSHLGFGIKPKLSLGSFYGYNYDVVLPEDTDRFQTGRFSNTFGLKYNTEISLKVRYSCLTLTAAYSPGLYRSPSTQVSDNLVANHNGGVKYNGEVGASLTVDF